MPSPYRTPAKKSRRPVCTASRTHFTVFYWRTLFHRKLSAARTLFSTLILLDYIPLPHHYLTPVSRLHGRWWVFSSNFVGFKHKQGLVSSSLYHLSGPRVIYLRQLYHAAPRGFFGDKVCLQCHYTTRSIQVRVVFPSSPALNWFPPARASRRSPEAGTCTGFPQSLYTLQSSVPIWWFAKRVSSMQQAW